LTADNYTVGKTDTTYTLQFTQNAAQTTNNGGKIKITFGITGGILAVGNDLELLEFYDSSNAQFQVLWWNKKTGTVWLKSLAKSASTTQEIRIKKVRNPYAYQLNDYSQSLVISIELYENYIPVGIITASMPAMSLFVPNTGTGHLSVSSVALSNSLLYVSE
jgi:hypothetical protein